MGLFMDAGPPHEEAQPSRLAAFFRKAAAKDAPLRVKAARSAGLLMILFSAMAADYLNFSGRPLAQDERADIHRLFRDSVDYNAFKVNAPSVMQNLGRIAVETAGGGELQGTTNGSRITFYHGEDKGHYSAATSAPMTKRTLRHESVHAWQHQNCPVWKRNLAKVFLGTVSPGDYSYDLTPGKDLLDYPDELQAAIIADSEALRDGDTVADLRSNKVLSRAELTKLYDGVLANFRKNPGYIAQNCAKF